MYNGQYEKRCEVGSGADIQKKPNKASEWQRQKDNMILVYGKVTYRMAGKHSKWSLLYAVKVPVLNRINFSCTRKDMMEFSGALKQNKG